MADRPVRSAYQVYAYAVCFIGTVVFVIFATRALLGLVHIAFPDQGPVFGAPFFEEEGFGLPEPDRSRGVAELLEGLVVAGMSGALFSFHWRRARAIRADVEPGPAAQAPAD